ncbi:annexin A1-like [Takifugu rubripes]|uniref:Annexin n=1 Tax=Takifugu rubripes TaxID=31033 RepID=H2TYU9_TAKRU|nr:annexin A1-like [Takifugu rubripes]
MSFFKKFFKNVIHDRDPDETVTVKGKKKPKYYGTIAPYPDFDPRSDASNLQSSIESRGVDEDVIVSILVKRNNEQRQKIKVVYEATAGERLDKALKSALRSDLEDVSLALLMSPATFDAYLIRKATKRLGTDEDVLVEIFATRTNKEILEIKSAFKEEYNIDLEDVIRDETSGDFTTALLAMLQANKDENGEVDTELARKDAGILFEAGENASGINVAAFIDILTRRSGPQLCKTFQQYAALSDISLPKALDLELKGDIEDCLIDIVKCAWNTPAFFAEKLHKAMKGHGTCEDTLIRILVSRSEIDLKKILDEYRAMYDVSVQEDILNDTKGHYRDVLLGICGAH